MILPPFTVCEETDKLLSFFQHEKENCRNNPHCNCGRYNWCAGFQITSPNDWRFESLPVAERTAVEYRYMLRKEFSTVPPIKPRKPTFDHI